MTQQFGFLFSNSVEFHTFYCFIFIYCVAALVMTLNVYFSPCLQKDCKTFLTRIKTSDSPVLYKGAQLWFFFSFMLPTRVFIMSSIIQSLSFRFIVGATILSGLPVIRTVLLAWFFILSENMSVGFFYHNSSRFKRVFDLFCGGSDMVLLFLGNTGSTALREFIKAVKAVGVGSVGVLIEDFAANVYSFGDAHLQKIYNPNLDFNQTWKGTKAGLNDSLPLRNAVKYFWK